VYFWLLKRACYLSSNPVKEETSQNEKCAFILPDGNAIEVIKGFFLDELK
jgi:hypothetical protein